MNPLSWSCISLGLVLGCGGPAKPAPEGPVQPESSSALDANVKEGNGWKRVSPGTWVWNADGDVTASVALGAEPSAAGIQPIPMPEGATGAKLSKVRVSYTGAGEAVWSVHDGNDQNAPGAQPVGEILAQIEATKIASVGGAPVWTEHDVSPPLALTRGPFFLEFESTGGSPTVGGFKNPTVVKVRYRPPGAAEGRETEFGAHVRVELTDVR